MHDPAVERYVQWEYDNWLDDLAWAALIFQF